MTQPCIILSLVSGNLLQLAGCLFIVIMLFIAEHRYALRRKRQMIVSFLEDLYAGKKSYDDIQTFATKVSKFPITIFDGLDMYPMAVQKLQEILRTRGDIDGTGRPNKENISEYFASRQDAILLAKTEMETFLNTERKQK